MNLDVKYNVYSNICSFLCFGQLLAENIFVQQCKSLFSKMACCALWNTTSDESFHSDVLSEIDYMYSTKESENKDTKCFFCNEKISEDERGEIWNMCFGCSLWAHLGSTAAENADCEFYKHNPRRNGFCIISKI